MAVKQSVERVKHTLDLKEEIDLQEKGWKVQRIGWVIIALIVIAAALGFFGLGPVSKQKQQFGNNSIEFERYMRYEAEVEIKLNVTPNNGLAVLTVPQQYLESFEISKVMPQPEKQEIVNDNYQFTFLTQSPSIVRVFLIPKKIGSVEGQITVNNQAITISQYIYP